MLDRIQYEDPQRDMDLLGLSDAYMAAQFSTDPSTQNGAAVQGVTGFNRQVDDHPPSGTDKNWSLVHAEEAALLECAAKGETTQDRTLYSPWACCTKCASQIIYAGISRVVIHTERMALTPPRWESEVWHGLAMLARNEVEVVTVSHYFGVTIRVNGEEVTL